MEITGDNQSRLMPGEGASDEGGKEGGREGGREGGEVGGGRK